MAIQNITPYFHFICIVLTTVLLCYCSWKYILNESSSLVDYQTFKNREKDIYPSFSLCFSSFGNFVTIYQKDNLARLFNITNGTKYQQFLNGEQWDERMLKVNYDDVTINFKDYVKHIYVRSGSTTSTPAYEWTNIDTENIDAQNIRDINSKHTGH